MKRYLIIALGTALILGCSQSAKVRTVQGGTGTGTGSPAAGTDSSRITVPASSASAASYMDLHDPIKDEGQYYIPTSGKLPSLYWTCVDIQNSDDRNSLGKTEMTRGLQYHLLGQSLAGLANRALDEGKAAFGLWLETRGEAYEDAKKRLGKEVGRQTAVELASKNYGPVEGVPVDVMSLVEGYVLTDVENNPESNIVGTVASHVFNAIMVDIRDKDYFDAQGYKMLYDASGKSTADAWKEFRDKCSNKALVVMPVQTGELREFAIKNKLFILNLNKKYGSASEGQNIALFDEVLDWLEPNAPVLGWEKGVGEDAFVSRISRKGKLMLAADWSYNHSLTSADFRSRQSKALAKVINPRDIKYDRDGKYLSFFLSDGDNYQWVMGDSFMNDYYSHKGISYGLCAQALSQLAPSRLGELLEKQGESSSIMECFGGGYFYADTYSQDGGRAENLSVIARRAASSMRQQRIKILHLMAMDVRSEAAKEAYRAFIQANDQLEGIVAIQYSPYNGGNGEIMWFTNSAGIDIPVLTAKYSLWKGSRDGQGSPQEIASLIREKEGKGSLSAVCVHAWSDFEGKKGAEAAADCMSGVGGGFKAVSVQELIWRIRMRDRREQTLEYLSNIK